MRWYHSMQPPALPPASPSPPDELRLDDLWTTLLRQRWLVIGIAAAVVVATAVFTARQRPVYQGESTIQFGENRTTPRLMTEVGPLAGLGALAGVAAAGALATEMMVLESRSIAEAVVDSLSLHVELSEPALSRSAVLAAVRAPRTARAALYELRRQEDGSYHVLRTRANDAPAQLPMEVEIGRPARVDDVEFVLNPELRSDPPEEIRFAVRQFRDVAEQVQAALDVARPSPGAQVVRLRYRSTDPELAALVPNVVTESFIRHKASTSRSESRNTIDFLRAQVDSYQQQLATAEMQMRAFREQHHVVSLPHQAAEQLRRLADFQANREELMAEREALGRLLERARAAGPSTDGESPYRQLAAFPSFLANPAIQNILASLVDLENRRSDLLVRRTQENIDVQGINRRIEELELQLYQTARNYILSVDTQLASLDNTLSRFASQLEVLPAQEVQFARLMREQKLLEQVYLLLQTRLKEAEIQEAADPDDVRVLDMALEPERPVAPRPVRNLLLATVLGLALGIAASVVRGVTDRKVRTRRDVALVTAGLPVLAAIPRINGAGSPAARIGWKRRLVRLPPHRPVGERLPIRQDPRGAVSEAYRTLRTSITRAGASSTPQALVLTSAMPGEGKTTSAANLAVAFAQQGTRTLLVDADLRSGSLHTVFELPQAPGFSQVLASGLALAEVVHEVEVGLPAAPLHFLSVGTLPANPAELLASARMREVLAEMRQRYEVILFDAPPLNLVTDAALLGAAADATLLVARSGVTDKRALEHAVAQLGQLQMPVGGVVLNEITASDAEYYAYAARGRAEGDGSA